MHAWRCAGGRQRGRGCSAALQPAYERREHVGWRCEACSDCQAGKFSPESSPRACLCTDPCWCCDQANTPPWQERALVWTVVQVRDWWSWCGLDFCFISASFLLHYCVTSVYKFFAPAFTPDVLIYICFTSVFLLLNSYTYIYALLPLYSCFTALYDWCNPSLLKYMTIFSCFTPTLLLLVLLCE